MTLYEQTAAALVANGDRSVTTYESGLCRVDQTYTCANANVATHRATLAIGETPPDGNDAPATDGLYIFPAPQEQRRPDGFTEFRVSAYGRVTTGLQNVMLSQRRANSSIGAYSVWEVTGTICLPINENVTLETLALDDDLLIPFDFVLISNPALKTLTVEEIETADTGPTIITGTASAGGKTFDITTIGPRRRKFQVEMTADGTTVASTFTFWLSDPRIAITSSRGFGSFMELEIQTQRDNTEAVIA